MITHWALMRQMDGRPSAPLGPLDTRGFLGMGNREAIIAVFYCQNIPGSSDQERQEIERRWGCSVRCFPLPCSGRLEQIHMLKSLEAFSDAVYVITCPEGSCRYFEGNIRARKRVEYTQRVLTEIGMDHERAGIVVTHNGSLSLMEHVEALREKASLLGPLLFHPDIYLG